MTRLDLLKKELREVEKLYCLDFATKDIVLKKYKHEIECIEVYGSSNDDINEERYNKFVNAHDE